MVIKDKEIEMIKIIIISINHLNQKVI